MKRNSLTLAAGIVLAIIFLLLLSAFQVRQTEVALLTTFGKPTGQPITRPGLYWKLPWPIQSVQKFDQRVHALETKFNETQTKDGFIVLVMGFAGWRVADPLLFREKYNGSISRAEADLEAMIRTAKTAIIGRHPFAHLLSTDPAELKFTEIENEMLQAVQAPARSSYGLEVQFVGLKRLGLPEKITEKVFERMREERQRHVQKLQAEGESEAIKIRTAADRDRAKILADAEAEATRIRGQADADAARYYSVFEKQPDLALLLLKLNAFEMSLKERATLVFDRNTAPFDVLNVPARESKPGN